MAPSDAWEVGRTGSLVKLSMARACSTRQPVLATARLTSQMRAPAAFWKKLDDLPTTKDLVPASATNALAQLLPERDLPYRLVHRIAGLGSLGRQRWVAVMDWRGGKLAHEAKALAPSACRWARASTGPQQLLYQTIMSQAVRPGRKEGCSPAAKLT